jgi:hypothetical protein
LVPLSTVRKSLFSQHWSFGKLPQAPNVRVCITYKANELLSVKFDSDQLPPILNALETENNGQRLVLEVAVCVSFTINFPLATLTDYSNIWERMSYDVLPWMV